MNTGAACLTLQLNTIRTPAPGSFEHNVLVGKAGFHRFRYPDNGQKLDPPVHPEEWR